MYTVLSTQGTLNLYFAINVGVKKIVGEGQGAQLNQLFQQKALRMLQEGSISLPGDTPFPIA